MKTHSLVGSIATMAKEGDWHDIVAVAVIASAVLLMITGVC